MSRQVDTPCIKIKASIPFVIETVFKDDAYLGSSFKFVLRIGTKRWVTSIAEDTQDRIVRLMFDIHFSGRNGT